MFRFKKLPVSSRDSALTSLDTSLGCGVVVRRRGKPQKRWGEPKAEEACEHLKFRTLGGIFSAEWLQMSTGVSEEKNDGVKTFGKYYSQDFLLVWMSSRSPSTLQWETGKVAKSREPTGLQWGSLWLPHSRSVVGTA